MDKPIHFKGLNGIRAIAALIVVIWHIDQYTFVFFTNSIGFYTNGMAAHMVDMFFVLSGFLITSLLLAEKEKTNTINIKYFYIRRILRIWPLYYLSILLTVILLYFGFVPESSADFSVLSYAVLLYILILPNFAAITNYAIPSIAPLWSMGVEEQFYLIWPQILKRTSKYIKIFILIFFLLLSLKLISFIVFTEKSMVFQFLTITRFSIMCIGAMGAYLIHSNHNFLNFIFRKDIQLISWGVLIFSIFYKPIQLHITIDNEVNSIFYFFIILNVASNKSTLISLENKFLNFIGKISYGIYVYHMIIIFITSHILYNYNITANLVLLYPFILITTIFIAWVSYNFFELPFLKMKKKYTIISSTDTIQNEK
jgi:peptidoglycan/LPS O-acetylase OafA/YrhL